ncbi:hypothetical protein NGUA41_01532 [Salmonella enterica]|nr:hypothetical protein NGUA40_03143 [Salmonella enterica]GAS76679.1 hypothetical protein NGUA41_01532 [Salmonella enterica]
MNQASPQLCLKRLIEGCTLYGCVKIKSVLSLGFEGKTELKAIQRPKIDSQTEASDSSHFAEGFLPVYIYINHKIISLVYDIVLCP